MARFSKLNKRMAPQVGLEPTTLRLTAGCSAIELLRSVVVRDCPFNNSIDAASRESDSLIGKRREGSTRDNRGPANVPRRTTWCAGFVQLRA